MRAAALISLALVASGCAQSGGAGFAFAGATYDVAYEVRPVHDELPSPTTGEPVRVYFDSPFLDISRQGAPLTDEDSDTAVAVGTAWCNAEGLTVAKMRRASFSGGVWTLENLCRGAA